MTAWDGRESMRRYMIAAPHRTAMQYLLDWCDEAPVVHWDQPDASLPTWLEVDKRMREMGRPSLRPAQANAAYTFSRRPSPVQRLQNPSSGRHT
jgi:hypothetical protein